MGAGGGLGGTGGVPPFQIPGLRGDGAVARARGRRAMTRDVELVVVDDPKEVAAVVAERLARAARAGGNVVLTGGKTPEQAYKDAAKQAPDWSKVDLWWGDERCVPPDDENSNYGMARKALLDNLEREPRSVHRMKGELGKQTAAMEYERELDDATLDLLLLGIGPDGHVASLFPHASTLRQRKHVL